MPNTPQRPGAPPPVIDEETYLARHGAGRQMIGDAALHVSSSSMSRNTWTRYVKAQSARDVELIALRDRLRLQYQAELAAGTLRAPTPTEQRAWTAAGHPDHDATHAARRLLGRQLRRRIDAAGAARRTLDALRWRGLWRPGALRAQARAWLTVRASHRAVADLILLLPDQCCVFCGHDGAGRLVVLAPDGEREGSWRLTCTGGPDRQDPGLFADRDEAVAVLLGCVRLASLVPMALPAPGN